MRLEPLTRRVADALGEGWRPEVKEFSLLLRDPDECAFVLEDGGAGMIRIAAVEVRDKRTRAEATIPQNTPPADVAHLIKTLLWPTHCAMNAEHVNYLTRNAAWADNYIRYFEQIAEDFSLKHSLRVTTEDGEVQAIEVTYTAEDGQSALVRTDPFNEQLSVQFLVPHPQLPLQHGEQAPPLDTLLRRWGFIVLDTPTQPQEPELEPS